MIKKRRMLLVGLMAAVLFGTFFTGLGLLAAADIASGLVWSDVELKETYQLGEDLAVPSRTLTVDGAQADTTVSLITPDGNGVRGDMGAVSLNVVGNWTARYVGILNGRTYVKDETFKVANPLYYFSGTGSLGEFVPYDADNGMVGCDFIKLSLSAGESVTFTPIIDLADATSANVLASIFALPENRGTADFNLLTVRLTDVLDPSCYLTYTCRGLSEYPEATYCLAGASTQDGDLVGLEIWNGQERLHRNDQYGTPVWHSFWASNGGKQSDSGNCLTFSYDSATRSAYVMGQFICDLDDPAHFPGKPFAGFPSGKVRLSISADLISGRYANIGVSSLIGVSDLSVTEYTEHDGPDLTIDAGGADPGHMPDAEVGREYPVPTATAFDYGTGKADVRITVWQDYNSNGRRSVPVKDGKFRVNGEGQYAIRIEAADAFGNTTEQILYVNALHDAPDVTIDADISSAEKDVFLGQWVEVPAFTAGGGSGAVKTVITAVSDRASFTLEEGRDGTYGFRPQIEGEYVVTYTATDYIGQTATLSYTVTANRSEIPVFSSEPQLPNYFVCYYNEYYGDFYEYVMPAFYADDYSSGSLQPKAASAVVSDAKGEYNVAAGEKFSPRVNGNGEIVTVTFTCGSAEPYVAEIPAVVPFDNENNGELDLARYFITNGAAVEIGRSSSTVSAESADGGWTYASPVLAENTQISLAGIAASANYRALRFELADMYDAAVTVCAKLRRDGTTWLFETGGNSLELPTSFFSDAPVTIGFDGNGFVMSNVHYAVTETVDGEPFEGFPSGKVYLSVYFEDATPGEAAYSLFFVDNQPALQADGDFIVPRIAFLGDRGGTYNIGSVVTLPTAMASDTLAPNFSSFTLSVTVPGGAYAKDVNGLELNGVDPTKEYRLKVDAYGQYSVTVIVVDGNDGPPVYVYYTINVIDDVAPEIKFAHDFTENAKVGDVLVVPSFTVTDNVSADEDLIVMMYVRTPSGKLKLLDQGHYAVKEGSVDIGFGARSNSVNATSAGKYTFIICAVDAAGNTCRIFKTVTVTEG